MCRDSTRRPRARGASRVVVDGTIDRTTSSSILYCTPYRVSTGTDDDAVFYEIGIDDVIGVVVRCVYDGESWSGRCIYNVHI